jgi:hypothetical protein
VTRAQTASPERLRTFRVGFEDGALLLTKAPVFAGHRQQADYDRGYDAGRRAHEDASAAYAVEIGYDPAVAILREGGAL